MRPEGLDAQTGALFERSPDGMLLVDGTGTIQVAAGSESAATASPVRTSRIPATCGFSEVERRTSIPCATSTRTSARVRSGCRSSGRIQICSR